MKVLLAHPGTQYSGKLAAQLHRHRALGAFHTGFAIVEGGICDRLLSFLPKRWTRRFSNRRVMRVPPELVHLHPWDEGLATYLRKLGRSQQAIFHARNGRFQQRLPDSALASADAVIGFDTSGWILAQRCQRRLPFVLDQSIGHPDSKSRVYEHLRKRFPGWSHDAEPRLKDVREAERIEHDLATLIVVPSTFAKNTLVENGVPAKKVRVNPFGVDISRFAPLPRQPRKNLRFCFVGSISVRKGVPLLLDAWRKAAIGDAELWLIGSASPRTAKIIQGYPNVVYKGPVPNPELPSLLNQCDVFVFPTFFEGFAQVIPEAMACGLPAITTTAAGADIIEHGKNGWVLSPGDEAGLVAMIEHCIAHPELVRNAGIAARQSAERYTWEHYGDRWRAILQEVANAEKVASPSPGMLAILSTHPIQYQVPLWQALARDGRVPFEVWYLTDHGTRVSHDREFGKTFAWDLETLKGYPYRFLESTSGATPISFWKWRLAENLASRLGNTGAKTLWIQGYQVAGYWQAAMMAKRAGVDLWLRGESNDLDYVSPVKRIAKRLILGQFFRRVDHFLYIGQANRRLYEKYGVPHDKLHFAPYAIDNERFARQADELRSRRLEIRRAWAIPDDAFCVLFCGKFIPKKRPGDLIAAAKLLAASNRIQKIHLLFVGSGELGSEMRLSCSVAFDADPHPDSSAAASDATALPPASFAGFLNQKDISQAYVASDCLALPSDSGETWGLVVNEAMASGLPCVASRACGCTEDLLAPQCPERTFELGDQEGLARSLEQVYRRPGSRQAEEERIAAYSLRVTVDQIAKLYDAISGIHRSPRS